VIKIPRDPTVAPTKPTIKEILGLGEDGIDEDGHYDETKDFTFLKRFKEEYPEKYEEFLKIADPEKYRELMIKQKEEHTERKKKEGDSDLVFNEKDNKRKK